MLQEIQLLRKLSFDGNIVQFYGACLQEENTMMVLEYMAVCLPALALYTGSLKPHPVLFAVHELL